MSQQGCSPLEVVLGVLGHYRLEISNRSGEISELNLSNGTTVEGIRRVGAGRDGAVVSLARLCEPPFFEIQVGKFFIIAGGGVVLDGQFQFVNPLAARKHLEGLPHQPSVRDDLDHDVYQRAQPVNENNPQPKKI